MTERSTATGRGPSRLFRALGILALLNVMSCEGCSGSRGGGGGGGGGGGTSSWLVGRDSAMLNITGPEHLVGRYPLEGRGDLLAIACWGKTRAWVAGDKGLVLKTEDAGATWRTIDLGTTARLRAVAIARSNTIFVAGDGGVFRVTRDGGLTWQAIASPAVDWSALVARHDGLLVLLTTATGDIYRWDGQALSRVLVAPAGPLHAIALSSDGLTAAAVGDGGVILLSSDGGLRWRERASGTTRALRDVWLIGDDGNAIFAVGDGGVLVDGLTASGEGRTPRTLGELTLRGLHLEASGHGAIVGDGGAVFVTGDFGTTWKRVGTGDARDLFGVDALGDEHDHL